MKLTVTILLVILLFLARVGQAADALESWQLQDSGTSAWLNSISYGDGLFVAVGTSFDNQGIPVSGVILTSPDGFAWTRRDSDIVGTISDVGFGNGKWVAVGIRWTQFVPAFLTSSDGVIWSTGYLRNQNGFGLSGVAFGEGLWVAVGGGGMIWTSLDGLNWSQRQGATMSPTNSLYHVAYGGGEWIATHWSSPRISLSLDGTTWVTFNSLTNNVNDITYGSGQFVAVGYDPLGNGGSGLALTLTSHDGIVWTFRNSMAKSGLSRVCYGNGVFVAVGGSGTILTSPDGISWTPHNSRTINNLNGVAYGNGRFVAVGISGTISVSGVPEKPPPAPLILGPIRFLAGRAILGSVNGNAGQNLVLEASTNLVNWQPLAVLTVGTNKTVQFADPSATNFSRRFYRAVSP